MLSFSLDMSGVFNTATTIINGLFPAYLIPLGITLGIGVLGLIAATFSKLLRGF